MLMNHGPAVQIAGGTNHPAKVSKMPLIVGCTGDMPCLVENETSGWTAKRQSITMTGTNAVATGSCRFATT